MQKIPVCTSPKNNRDEVSFLTQTMCNGANTPRMLRYPQSRQVQIPNDKYSDYPASALVSGNGTPVPRTTRKQFSRKSRYLLRSLLCPLIEEKNPPLTP